MKYICNDCLSEFNKSEEIKTVLIDLSISICPFCMSNNINYTKKYLLKKERKNKLKKLNE